MRFAVVVILMAVIFVVHEWGHYLAYRLFGVPASFRRSFWVPQVLPREDVVCRRSQGIAIALSGFLWSGLLVILPSYFLYHGWDVLLVGGTAGSVVDFGWALSMLGSRNVKIKSGHFGK